MKTRKFGHADAMAIQTWYRNYKFVPTLQQLKTMCGMARVQDKGIIEFLEIEKLEYKKE